jgi:HrpA-like RNA helicase
MGATGRLARCKDSCVLYADGRITSIGEQMVAMPLEPMLGRALLASLDLNCAPFMLTIAAMLSVETLFHSEPSAPHGKADDDARVKQKQEILVCASTLTFNCHV